MTNGPDTTSVFGAPSRRTILRGLGAAGIGAAALSAAPGWARSATAARPTPPNVLVISIDDLGWDELGCYGNTFNETPNIDALARGGIRFDQAYAAAPVCSPSRAAFMTGLYPARTGITDFLRGPDAPSAKFLDPELTTLPEVLRPFGYASGLIGKWHLTEYYSGDYASRPGNPYAHGFDEVIASEQKYIAGGDYFHPYFFMPDLPARTEGEYLTDRLADEAVDYIRRNAHRPFFLHLSNYSVHTTLSAKEDLIAKYAAKPGAGDAPNRPVLAAMLESVDQQVGRVLAALEEEGIAERTLLIVTADNGGPYLDANEPLRGGKGDVYEGGLRVPFVASWPGHALRGEVSHEPVSWVDLLPTALDLAGGAPERGGFDGVSLRRALLGSELDRDRLFWVYPHVFGAHSLPRAAVREGRYKLVESLRHGETELFDLYLDPSETTDLANTRPQVAARLTQALDAHVAETRILAPRPSPATYPVNELAETFDHGLDGWEVLTVEGTPAKAGVADGRAYVTADAPAHHLFRSNIAPGSDQAVLILDPGTFALTPGQDTVFVGLVKDAGNYVILRYHHGLKRVGWDLRIGGRLITAGQEPLTRLDGTTDLSGENSRYAVVLRGTTGTAYADQGSGWEFLFAYDAGEVIDLRRPEVRADYHYGFGIRLNSGTITVDGIEARTT